ncbi:MAG: hypothetical protein WB995_02205 [Candidatus Acidiferrales bacterium]
MKSLVGLLVVALLCILLYVLILKKTSPTGGGTPQQTIDVTGVKNDLIAIAQAERAYQAEHGAYASLADLVSSGSLVVAKTGRDGYTYEVESSSTDFRVVAHCAATPQQPCTSYFVDSSMEVQVAP